MNAVRYFRPVGLIVPPIVALIFAAFSLILSAALVPDASGQTQVQMGRPDPANGKTLFSQNCVNCHGVDATGEEGPNLHSVPAALGDAAVAGIIRRGIPGTGMPSSYILSEQDAADIVAWLRSFDSAAQPPAVGDAKKGEDVYNASGCSTCHMIDGAGGNIGPDLSRIGAGRGPANLKARLIDPGANLPKSVGGFVDGGGWTQYVMFRALEKDGHATEGMRVSEDSFSIVLKDAQGKLHGFRTLDLASLSKETDKSFMPSFKDTLSSAQMDDLIAYLSSLKAPQ